MQVMRRHLEPSEDTILLGTHQAISESIVYVLLGDELPDEWRPACDFLESIRFEIVRIDQTIGLRIQFRGLSRIVSMERVSEIVQAYRAVHRKI